MKRTSLIGRLMTFFAFFLLSAVVYAVNQGKPLWTFSQPIPAILSVPVNGVGTVQYQVCNQSPKHHQLAIKPLPGVSQGAPCSVTPKGTSGSCCTLILNATGSELPVVGISGGPSLCQINRDGRPNPNQCYQPSQSNGLKISVEAAQFTVSASGDAHVTPSPTSQQVNYNSTGTITLNVTTGYTTAIASDTCGGSLSGNTYTTGKITGNCSVSFSSTIPPSLTWSQSSVNYFVLSSAIVTLTYAGSGTPPTVALTESTDSLTLVASPNTGTPNVCDFSHTTVCTVTISGGNSGPTYSIIGTPSKSITIASLPVTLNPVTNYISSLTGAGKIFLCLIESANGQFDGNTCNASNGSLPSTNFQPYSLGFNQIGTSQYIYVVSTSYYGATTNDIYTCTLNNTGQLNNDCTLNNGGATFTDLYGAQFYNGKLYVLDYGASNVYLCNIDQSNGQPSTCTISNGGDLSGSGVDGITVYNNYVYLSGYSNGKIYTCTLDPDGGLNGCTYANNTSFESLGSGPTGLAAYRDYLYIADWSGYEIDRCQISGNSLINCAVVPTGGILTASPEQLTIQGSVLYIADDTAGLIACNISSTDGSLSGCAATPASNAPSWYPSQTLFNPFNQ